MQNISKINRVVCVAAHPDDEVLGLGGTLIRHANKGDEVFIIILSEGEEAKTDKTKRNISRKNNANKCSNIIGSNLYKIFDYPDQKLDTVPILEIITNLENIFKELSPDIAYVHHPTDINKDHQIASQASLTALRPMNNLGLLTEIRAFETPSSTEQAPHTEHYIFKPNLYVSIDEIWQNKINALEAYSNELESFPHPRSLKAIEALAIKRGVESGFKKAEAFTILRKMWE